MVPPNSHRVSRAPRYSGYHYQLYRLTHTGLSPSMVHLSRWFQFNNTSNVVVLQPHTCRNKRGLGYSDFARHYSRNHSCFLLLRLLRCFSSPGSLARWHDHASHGRVAPFGHLRITAYVQLPAAFRSLSRPSSPLGA